MVTKEYVSRQLSPVRAESKGCDACGGADGQDTRAHLSSLPNSSDMACVCERQKVLTHERNICNNKFKQTKIGKGKNWGGGGDKLVMCCLLVLHDVVDKKLSRGRTSITHFSSIWRILSIWELHTVHSDQRCSITKKTFNLVRSSAREVYFAPLQQNGDKRREKITSLLANFSPVTHY